MTEETKTVLLNIVHHLGLAASNTKDGKHKTKQAIYNSIIWDMVEIMVREFGDQETKDALCVVQGELYEMILPR